MFCFNKTHYEKVKIYLLIIKPIQKSYYSHIRQGGYKVGWFAFYVIMQFFGGVSCIYMLLT